MHGQRTVLFIDEIHRFNKAQQDAILPLCRGRHGHPDRRDHREPIVRGQRARCSLARGSWCSNLWTDRDIVDIVTRALDG